MGQVTFNGDIATAESQAYIKQIEVEILSSPGDKFQKARELEIFYQNNGLKPGTFERAGSGMVGYDRDDNRPVYRHMDMGNVPGFFRDIIWGAVLILLLVGGLKIFGG